MNKHIFILYLIILFTASYGCKEKQQADTNTIGVDLNDKQEVSIFDIFSKVDIIPLETNDSSLIKVIFKLLMFRS